MPCRVATRASDGVGKYGRSYHLQVLQDKSKHPCVFQVEHLKHDESYVVTKNAISVNRNVFSSKCQFSTFAVGRAVLLRRPSAVSTDERVLFRSHDAFNLSEQVQVINTPQRRPSCYGLSFEHPFRYSVSCSWVACYLLWLDCLLPNKRADIHVHI